MARKNKKATGQPGPLVPDRSQVPDPGATVTREADESYPHRDTNWVSGLDEPGVEAKAPGRSTHGATNNP